MAENKKQLLITIGAALGNNFNAVISGSTSKLKSVGAAIKDMEKNSLLGASSLDKLKNRYNSLLGSMNRQQAIIQKRGFYRSQIMGMVALGASLAVPIRSAMKFEDSLAKIKAVVNFPEPDGLKKLGDTFNKMSQSIPITADELASIASIGGRFGVAAKDLATFSQEVGKTAIAWRAPVEETAEKVGNLMKVFNVSTSQLPQYFDAINYLGNKTGATADNILKALNRSADGLANFKLSLPQAAALTSTIMSFGEGAEQAGSAVGNMLQKLSNAKQLGIPAQKVLHSIGLTAAALPKMIAEDPQKVLTKLFEGFSKLKAEDRSSALYSIFGRGASKTVGKLIENLELYRKNLQLVADQNTYKGSRDEDYNIVASETKSQIQLLQNSFSTLSKEIGFSLLPALKSILTTINSILTPIVKWMGENKELTTTITTAIAGLISFRIATFALGYASTFLFGGLNKIVIGLKAIQVGFTLANVACKGFLGWALGLVTMAWLIYENWDTVKDFLLKIWEPIKPYWIKFTELITKAWTAVKDFFLNIWGGIISYWDAFTDKMDELGVTENITAAWTAVRDFFSDIWDGVTPYWDAFALKMKEWGVTGTIISAWTRVKNFFIQITNGIIDAWNRVKNFFLQIWNTISPIIDKITKPLSNLWDGAKSGVQKISNLLNPQKNTSTQLKIPRELKPANSNVTRNQNNNFTINIQTDKNDNPDAIANKVMNRVSDYSKTFLYDEVAEAI